MAWRKADNWTAFTDGYMTWINGPNGLQSRLNTDRFPWEAGGSSASTTTAPCNQPNVPNGCPISIGQTVTAVVAQPGDQHKWVLIVTSPASARISLANSPPYYALHVLRDPSASGLMAEVTDPTTSNKSP